MSKYNEVMKNIVVTDEMRSRVLQNIESRLKDAPAGEADKLEVAKSFEDTDEEAKSFEARTEDVKSGKVDTEDIKAEETKIEEINAVEIQNKEATTGETNKEATDEFRSGNKKNTSGKIIKFIRNYGAKAAIFALIVAGSYGVIRTVGLNSTKSDSTSSSYEYAAETTESAEGLESSESEEYIEGAEAMESSESTRDSAESSESMNDNAASTESTKDSADSLAIMYDDTATMEAEDEETTAEIESSADAVAEAAAEPEEYDEADHFSGYAMEEAAEAPEAVTDESSGELLEETKGLNNSAKSEMDRTEENADKSLAPERIGTLVKSKEELTKALGYDFEIPEELAADAEKIYYSLYDDGGEIQYVFEDGSVYYYVSDKASLIDEKIPGPDNFSSEDSTTINGKEVTIYTDYQNRKMATWQNGDIFYGITLYSGMDESILEVVIR